MKVRVERMTPEGQGLARPEGGGRVVFIPYAAPGDLLEVETRKVSSGYARAEIKAILEPGPGRVEPRCPLHYRPPGPSGDPARPPVCGGCDWQHLSLEAQLEAKRGLVLDCLARIGKLPQVPVEPVFPSPEPWRYRNKVQVPVGREGGRVVAGFYAPGSHRIVDFPDCLVQPELSVRLALKVKELAGALGWSPYDEASGTGWLRHAFARTTGEGKAMLALVTRTKDFPARERFVSAMREAFPELVSLFQNVQPMKTSVVLGPEWVKLWGEDRLEERLGPLRLGFSPGSFLQVNTPACEVLYEIALAELAQGGFRPELALDLYCGIGSISLWIAPAAGQVLGVEESRTAVEDARRNARANGVANVRFSAGRVETLLGEVRRALERAAPGKAAAVLDPPRAGVGEAALKCLRSPALARVVYVSCDPATFARDAAWLVKYGYRLSSVRPVDLFPQTSHVEIVARFDR